MPDTAQRRVEEYLDRGGRLTDGDTVLECFDVDLMATALEKELHRAMDRGQTELRITMGLHDVAAFIRFLRRATLLGA